MAASPAFAATPKVGAGIVPATLDTSLTAPANVTTIFTGGTNGSKVEEIVLQGIATTVAGIVNLFMHDGTTYHLIDQFLITAVTSSTTAVAFRLNRLYQNLLLPSTSHSLRVTCTIAGLQSTIKVAAYGADY